MNIPNSQMTIMKRICLFLLLPVLWTSVQAQGTGVNVRKNMALAWQYLHGPYKPFDPGKAFQLYQQCALQGDPSAMNALAEQYALGTGTQRDESSAFKWFRRAAVGGYPAAWYTLGMYYKYGKGCSMDYEKSYAAFKKAADEGVIRGYYGQGYMLYKGLGCTQDYAAAVTLFRKVVAANYVPGMYFMGLCYRNGYGVAMDKDSARYWLRKAASMGYQHAKDELTMDVPENNSDAAALVQRSEYAHQLQESAGQRVMNAYNKLQQPLTAAGIEGTYKGYLMQYDWGGSHMIKNSVFSLQLQNDGQRLRATWTDDQGIELAVGARLQDKDLVFDNMLYSQTDHYSPRRPVQFAFDDARLQWVMSRDSLFLVGKLQAYAPDRMEPDKPLHVVLVKDFTHENLNRTSRSDDADAFYISAYPNPFISEFTVEFTLKKAGDVYTGLFTQDGKVIYSNIGRSLEAGSYALPIQANVSAGVYVLTVHGDNIQKSMLVVKQ